MGFKVNLLHTMVLLVVSAGINTKLHFQFVTKSVWGGNEWRREFPNFKVRYFKTKRNQVARLEAKQFRKCGDLV